MYYLWELVNSKKNVYCLIDSLDLWWVYQYTLDIHFVQIKMANKKIQWVEILEDLLSKIEQDIKRVKMMIHQIAQWEQINPTLDLSKATASLNSPIDEWDMTVVEGVYDGYFMVWTDKKKYPVPMNYSSKTKLIPGDVLKLRIMTDWKLIYKLIGQANRQYIKATLSKSDDGKFTALTDEWKVFYLNQAAVTYFRWKTGDEMSIIVNAEGIWTFAAIEALIPQWK
jgi:hypothetical protein